MLTAIYVPFSFVAAVMLGLWFWLGGNQLRHGRLGNKALGVVFFLLGLILTTVSGLASKRIAHPEVYALGLFFELLSAGWLAQFWKKRPRKG